jgi:hypothetical protein
MSESVNTNKIREYCTNTICNSCEKVEGQKARMDVLNNYGILIEDIRNYCRLQPKTNYTAQRILEAIEKGYWG